MPVTAQIGRVLRHHDQVVGPGNDGEVAAGADVGLASRIRLHRDYDHVFHLQPPMTAQITAPTVRASAPTTSTMSSVVLVCARNGLKPMSRHGTGLDRGPVPVGTLGS